MRFVGVILIVAACGGRSHEPVLGGPDGSVGGNHKHVFVTDAAWTGDFWIQSGDWPSSFGPDQADVLCSNAAVGAGLGGTWKAWISSYGTSSPTSHAAQLAADRIKDVGPWYLIGTETVVFNNKANLLNTPLAQIDVNEHGVALQGVPVWTGTRVGGQVLEDCGEWQTQDDQVTGTLGDSIGLGNYWTQESSAPCRSTQAHLYCFEQ
ncbi:MAG TPA: hypothetical protein VL463_34385 [Kofleriaceae bacterium]|jgi:hypothetical protein|nr:hypothetical protein [Kofleriaceae bacterium]